MSYHYSSVRGKLGTFYTGEEMMPNFGTYMVWDLTEARSTCGNMRAAAMATTASRGKLLHESRHPDFLTWAFELVPSVVQCISFERVPLTTSVPILEPTGKYMLARGSGVQRRIHGGTATLLPRPLRTRAIVAVMHRHSGRYCIA